MRRVLEWIAKAAAIGVIIAAIVCAGPFIVGEGVEHFTPADE
ncbi:hypothetical protein [Bradyrhizobium elkanii]|uniref:Uncharacterized protein n=1 Tax=Bradyrhizobium elkanii TaxID=29448 RepID=A0A8I1YB20_BRAEL|nr:hypothetical protein [Bradyrhizobium elkanii]MBP1296626.1 hypothetical protein [Bradyrhizobium elkanii]